MTGTTTLYLADDHKILLEGLWHLVSDEPSLIVIGKTTDSEIAFKEIAAKKPDLAILDWRMPPGMTGLDIIHKLKHVTKETKFIILSMHDDPQMIRDARNAGAAGYILKNGGKSEVMACINAVLSGELYFPKLTEAKNKRFFTPKEFEIVKLVVAGKTTAQIAEELHISPFTVETHRKSICRKTNTNNPLSLHRFLEENKIDIS